MPDGESNEHVRAVIIGTRHEFQRHQDTAEDREKVRLDFEKLLRDIVQERGVTLIAEEAGNDRAVWEVLKAEEEGLGDFVDAFGGGRTVEQPVSTIAKNLSTELSSKVRHVDIRVDVRDFPQVDQRDEAMAAKVTEILGASKNVLVIVGESHRQGLAQRLAQGGFLVKSFRFPN